MVYLDKIVVTGGHPLKGTVEISGSKNAVLPIMAGTLLADGEYRIRNVPALRDVRTMARLLKSIGSITENTDHILKIRTNGCNNPVSLPGGCAWGPRPVDLHIEGLKRMGAKIIIKKGYIIARADRLQGAHINFRLPSVGATAHMLLSAVLADGLTCIENAAREPEIGSLAKFLNKMGAHITGIDTDHLCIEGVSKLHPTAFTVIPDRIETGTFLIAGHITGGKIRLEKTKPKHVISILDNLRKSGSYIKHGSDWVLLESDGHIHPVDVVTAVYPGFPTDMQAQWMSLMTIANGSSSITDTIYYDRFAHVAELRRMGANITSENNTAFIRGIKYLSGAPVMSTDLRASASLILAGLVAKGKTDISRVYHIDRGYERIEKKLKKLGAEISRELEELVI